MLPPAFPPELRRRFRPLGVLGQGRGGVVHLVDDRGDAAIPRKALKCMTGERLTSDEWAQISGAGGAGARHPAIARLLDHGHFREGLYLTMEPCLGPDLASLDFRPEAGVLIKALPDLVSALAALHESGLLHNDIKPCNIRLAAELPAGAGAFKLVDLGPSMLVRGGPPVEAAQPCYVAPERLRGEPFDQRADIYALGATLFRAFAGEPHVAGRRAHELLRAMTSPPSLAVACPDLPAWIAAIVDRALAWSPRDRFASASEMREALEGADRRARPPAPSSGAFPASQPRLTRKESGADRFLEGVAAFLRGAEPEPELPPDASLVHRSPLDAARACAADLHRRRAAPVPTAVVPASPSGPGTLDACVADLERMAILEALRACENNQTRAAQRLGISRRGLWLKMRRHGIPLRRDRRSAPPDATGAQPGSRPVD